MINTDDLLKWIRKSGAYYTLGLWAVVILMAAMKGEEPIYALGQAMGGWLMYILLYFDLKLYIKKHGEKGIE